MNDSYNRFFLTADDEKTFQSFLKWVFENTNKGNYIEKEFAIKLIKEIFELHVDQKVSVDYVEKETSNIDLIVHLKIDGSKTIGVFELKVNDSIKTRSLKKYKEIIENDSRYFNFNKEYFLLRLIPRKDESKEDFKDISSCFVETLHSVLAEYNQEGSAPLVDFYNTHYKKFYDTLEYFKNISKNNYRHLFFKYLESLGIKHISYIKPKVIKIKDFTLSIKNADLIYIFSNREIKINILEPKTKRKQLNHVKYAYKYELKQDAVNSFTIGRIKQLVEDLINL